MTIAEDRSLRDDISFGCDHRRVRDTQETLTLFARAVLAREVFQNLAFPLAFGRLRLERNPK